MALRRPARSSSAVSEVDSDIGLDVTSNVLLPNIRHLARCYLNELCIPVSTVPTFLLSVPLLVVIWSYPGRGYNSATGHFMWLVRSPGTVSYGTREGTSREKHYLVRTRWFLVRKR